MTNIELIFIVLLGLFLIISFVLLGFTIYIGKTRIKEIDRIVYGYEFPNDSIFALMIRVPNYAGAFFWRWSARRSGLEGKIEHFDKNFKWPFIVHFMLMILGGVNMIVLIIFDKYFNVM